MTKTYTVTYSIINEGPRLHATRCAVTEGYSTLADVPKMIAIRIWGDAEKAELIEIESLVKN